MELILLWCLILKYVTHITLFIYLFKGSIPFWLSYHRWYAGGKLLLLVLGLCHGDSGCPERSPTCSTTCQRCSHFGQDGRVCGGGVRQAATLGASSWPLSKAMQPYSEALVSAKKLAQEWVDLLATLHPYCGMSPSLWSLTRLPDYHCVSRWLDSSGLGCKIFIFCLPIWDTQGSL